MFYSLEKTKKTPLNALHFQIISKDDDVASVSNTGHLSIHRIRHREENDLPPLVDGAVPDVRDFASNIKEAKRRNITKLQSTIEEVMNCPHSELFYNTL